MNIEVLHDDPVENGVALVRQPVDVASKGHQIGFQLGRDILPNAPRANAIPSAVVAVPILILQNLI